MATLDALRSHFAAAAQAVYDAWDQDEEGYCDAYGDGGICHDIAGAICDVLSEYGFPCTTFSFSIGEVHVTAVTASNDGTFFVDIHPSWYETGGGYCWRKIPGVTFTPDMISLEMVSPDPADFEEYAGDY